MASAEDVIISKLEWAQRSGSERQLRDVKGILAAKADQLDLQYIERWAGDLGLMENWRRAQG